MKVAVVWNGDKDSAVAYSNVKEKFDISFLLTFLHEKRSNARFLSAIKRQSEKLGVPFFWAKVNTARPEDYRETMAELKEDYGVEAIVTNGDQRLIEDACRAIGLKAIKA